MSVLARLRSGKLKLGLKLMAPLCVSVGILVTVRLLGPEFLDQQRLSGYLRPLGHWAPLAFIFLLGVRPAVLLPGQLFAAVGGILFGTVLGTVYSLLGSLLATGLIHLLASRFGRGPMKRLAGHRHDGLQRAARNHGFQVGFLACINSVIPGDVMLAAASASGARYLPLALGAAVGSIPGTLLTTSFGSSLSQGKTWTTLASVAGLLVSLALGVFLGRRLAREMKIEAECSPQEAEARRPAAAASRPLLGKMQQRGAGAV
ncbi:membrane protein [Melittangium boletus DSM 14713]|uniref:TVP38/TMEM64 family membrane protein n=2 Tax=Melittangium boletus TaxID=83453 RepID=A0A250IHE0_9BACT|nr:membrane protein [Melittangium boletus DSM 14713]